MGTERLSNLMLLAVHRERKVDVQAAREEFFRLHPHRPKAGMVVPKRRSLFECDRLLSAEDPQPRGDSLDAPPLEDASTQPQLENINSAGEASNTLPEEAPDDLEIVGVKQGSGIRVRAPDIQNTFPPFPLPRSPLPQQLPDIGLQARVVDFLGTVSVPRQMVDWLRSTGVTVRQFLTTSQIPNACGYIAAEVVSRMWQGRNDGREITDEELQGANTAGALQPLRASLGISEDETPWLSDSDIYGLISQRMGLVEPQVIQRVHVGPWHLMTGNLFAEHRQLYANSGETHYYVINTDHRGQGIHWFTVEVHYPTTQTEQENRGSSSGSADTAMDIGLCVSDAPGSKRLRPKKSLSGSDSPAHALCDMPPGTGYVMTSLVVTLLSSSLSSIVTYLLTRRRKNKFLPNNASTRTVHHPYEQNRPLIHSP
jgi:hypothetical protein